MILGLVVLLGLVTLPVWLIAGAVPNISGSLTRKYLGTLVSPDQVEQAMEARPI